MKLTCVTATWNVIKAGNRESLIRCVKSVAALKTEHEHLIYDGASTDGTAELLRELEATTPGLKVVSEPDTGIYNALNKGVRDAKGEWFYVLGADDYLHAPGVMDDAILQLGEDCDIYATSVKKLREDESHEGWINPKMTGIFNFPCACHQGEIMRTEIARELGGFDEQYRIAADSDMFLKAHLHRYRFVYANEAFASFVGGGTAETNIDNALREHRISVANVLGLKGISRKMMIEKWFLPFISSLRLSFHKDIVIRSSAREMVKINIKLLLRIPLYPLVVLTRPLRYRTKK